MSRTEDRYRLKRARRSGFLAGKFGEKHTENPYRAVETNMTWRDGWADGSGHKDLPCHGKICGGARCAIFSEVDD